MEFTTVYLQSLPTERAGCYQSTTEQNSAQVYNTLTDRKDNSHGVTAAHHKARINTLTLARIVHVRASSYNNYNRNIVPCASPLYAKGDPIFRVLRDGPQILEF
jgi:hypothetical protein